MLMLVVILGIDLIESHNKIKTEKTQKFHHSVAVTSSDDGIGSLCRLLMKLNGLQRREHQDWVECCQERVEITSENKSFFSTHYASVCKFN